MSTVNVDDRERVMATKGRIEISRAQLRGMDDPPGHFPADAYMFTDAGYVAKAYFQTREQWDRSSIFYSGWAATFVLVDGEEEG